MATLTVTNLNDSGAGSLRDILNQANSTAGVDSIVFQSGLSGTLTLTSGDLDITDSVTITGSGITISGGNTSGIFYLYNPTSELDVTLTGLTLSGGSNTSSSGGAILSKGENLTVADSVITGNRATNGGGIAVYDANLTVDNSQITGNTASNEGGGIYFRGENGELLRITDNSAIANNTADQFGGIAIRSTTGSGNGVLVTIDTTSMTGNKALNGAGGGIGLQGSNINATLTGSTITGNIANELGGGINLSVDNSSLAIATTTIANNTSGSSGGGINSYSNNLDLILADSTLSNNVASGSGGAIRFLSGGGVGDGSSLSIEDSDISDNVASQAALAIAFFGGDANRFELSDSNVQNNTADTQSAGILINDGSFDGGVQAAIDNSVITGNRIADSSLSSDGGGITLSSFLGESILTISNSMIANNNGSSGEVDLYNYVNFNDDQGTLNVTNSLIENPGDAINGTNTGNRLGVEPNTITLTVSPLTTAEGGAALVYTFSRSGSTTDALTVNFTYTGTASLGTDYKQTGATAFANGTGSITFNPGAATATLTLTVLDDALTTEGSETVTLSITDGFYFVGEAIASTATGKILDNGPTGVALEAIDFTRKKNRKGSKEWGTKGKDNLVGTGKDDALVGRDGKDKINGKGGKDRIFGDAGNDDLKGAGGNDQIVGGTGDDRVTGGGGNDQIFGQDGNDTLTGQGGRDVLIGGLGTDTLSGGEDIDTFVFNSLTEGIDTITDFNGDLIDLRGILSASQYTAVNAFQTFTQFVQFVQVGANTELRIDADGLSAGSTFTTLAVLNNIAATSLTSSNVIIE